MPISSADVRTVRRRGKMRIVPVEELVGRVVVVAGETPMLADVAALAAADAAQVALVSRTLPDRGAPRVRFRTDADVAANWDRLAMHVEQHLGPVDAVVTDAAAADVVRAVFAADLERRGHGAVLVVRAGDDPAAVVRQILDTQ